MSVAADHFVLKPGKPLEVPVTISRSGGFDEELVLTVADLPEGINGDGRNF